MRPIMLTMQAFGSYGQKTEIDFRIPNQNLFLITGPTGAGKTTVFDAIAFALYGEASSNSNRKSGEELQSHFADYSLTPYVELTFSELSGGEQLIYTVRRTPRHIRRLKKGSGVKDEKERVSLILPDGREYSPNRAETNAKLVEIIGLTKSQFSQIAMIAQGEFMDSLREDSNRKKEIFRKLFGTGMFQQLIEELNTRRKDKLAEISEIRSACRAELSRISVPEGYEHGAELSARITRLRLSDGLNIAELEQLMTALKALCGYLRQESAAAKLECENAGARRDAARDALRKAETLLQAFAQAERAKAALDECRSRAAEMSQTAELIKDINTAYVIYAEHLRLADNEKHLAELRQKQSIQSDILPKLRAELKPARDAEQEARLSLDRAAAEFVKTDERVKAARLVFSNLARSEERLRSARLRLDGAAMEKSRSAAALLAFEEQLVLWRSEGDALAGAREQLENWSQRKRELLELKGELEELRSKERAITAQKHQAERARLEYEQTRTAYSEKSAQFLDAQNTYLDAQAGFIAKERLRPNEPCPVCGSTEHPSPCSLSPEHSALSRDMIDSLAAELHELQTKQTDSSARAGSANEQLRAMELSFEQSMARLRGSLARRAGAVPEELSLSSAVRLLSALAATMSAEGAKLTKNAKRCAEILEALKGSDAKRQSLKSAAEKAETDYAALNETVIAERTSLSALENQSEYQSPAHAERELSAASSAKSAAEQLLGLRQRAHERARSAVEQAETMLCQYTRELPIQEQTCQSRRQVYKQLLENKAMSEENWKALVSRHRRDEPERLQRGLDDYSRRKAAAESALKTAAELIGDNEKPQLEELQNCVTAAEESLRIAREGWDMLRECYRADLSVYSSLAPRLEDRRRIMREYNTIDSLYTRLSGKLSGARMDIETFVQRYYLSRILYAANRHFRQMSAGQFELRMVDESQAGDGKNRGLDLMVYSFVTGREREVRTLSGGESFMAALSLALGMADRIQYDSAAVNLDMMFIDEGFGALDEHSRNQAVKVLQQLSAGTKLIGIISHVTELKQEIENQLQITKSSSGSQARWSLG